jgi:nucleotide-binding universal stress UspA family protein
MLKPFVPTFAQIPMPTGAAVWQEDDGHRVLEEAVKIAKDTTTMRGQIKISTTMKFSPPVPKLVKMSDGAEMVVVGSTGRGAAGRLLLGSVSSAVVRNANCPVAVIHEGDPVMPHPHQAPVLVGIDGSRASERATAIAFDEASRRGVELTALHTWNDVEVLELPGVDWAAVKGEGERSLAEGLAGWQECYPDVKVHRLIVRDWPARQLIEQSRSAQLVVVGCHGRGGLTGALLGSVSHAVVHAVHTPVIVARPS